MFFDLGGTKAISDLAEFGSYVDSCFSFVSLMVCIIAVVVVVVAVAVVVAVVVVAVAVVVAIAVVYSVDGLLYGCCSFVSTTAVVNKAIGNNSCFTMVMTNCFCAQ